VELSERKEMIDPTHELPIVRQCQILQLARSTAYYQPQPESQEDLALMRRIDELHMDWPFAGARMLRRLLKREGQAVGRRHISTLMQRMGIHALYRKPNTSRRYPAHKVYPYLLRNLPITRSNHVWAADITYIPMKRGFVYLFAVLDWAALHSQSAKATKERLLSRWLSRRVLSWRVSNTLTTDFCIEAVQEAINRYGKPDIFNTDQGCHNQ
jgi:putative transposase